MLALQRLVAADDADGIDALDASEWAPESVVRQLVLFAVQQGHADALAALLARSPAAAAPEDGTSPAWLAAAAGDDLCLAVLLAVDPAEASRVGVELSPASIAALRGHRRCIEVVAEWAPAALVAGEHPAACAAAMSGHSAVLGVLARLEGALDVRDSDGRTPAYLAAAHGHAACLHAVAAHAPESLSAQVGEVTPIEVAFTKGNDDCVRVLLALGQPNPSTKWQCGCNVGEVCAPGAVGQRAD